jgi:hypothetical protein
MSEETCRLKLKDKIFVARLNFSIFEVSLSFKIKMGSSQSVEIPGGGTEGYHVLRVSSVLYIFDRNYNFVHIITSIGAK